MRSEGRSSPDAIRTRANYCGHFPAASCRSTSSGQVHPVFILNICACQLLTGATTSVGSSSRNAVLAA